MTANIYTVKDEMTGSFLNPAVIKTDEEAKRMFKYQINNTPIWTDNPEDFSLYKVGTLSHNMEIFSTIFYQFPLFLGIKNIDFQPFRGSFHRCPQYLVIWSRLRCRHKSDYRKPALSRRS